MMLCKCGHSKSQHGDGSNFNYGCMACHTCGSFREARAPGDPILSNDDRNDMIVTPFQYLDKSGNKVLAVLIEDKNMNKIDSRLAPDRTEGTVRGKLHCKYGHAMHTEGDSAVCYTQNCKLYRIKYTVQYPVAILTKNEIQTDENVM